MFVENLIAVRFKEKSRIVQPSRVLIVPFVVQREVPLCAIGHGNREYVVPTGTAGNTVPRNYLFESNPRTVWRPSRMRTERRLAAVAQGVILKGLRVENAEAR